MRKDLLRRLERLENRLEMGSCPVLFFIRSGIEDAQRNALAPNERIVYDRYRDFGRVGEARERVTTDPMDQGRACLPGGYLEDVIRELHEVCEMRDCGGCGTCSGLEHLFSQAGSDHYRPTEPAPDG